MLALKKLDTEPVTLEKTDHYGNSYLVDSVDINTQEIRMLTGRSGGSIYKDVKEASIALAQNVNIAEDPELHQYVIIPMYSKVTYDNGVLHIEYSNEASPYLRNVSTNYTNLSLPIMFSFCSRTKPSSKSCSQAHSTASRTAWLISIFFSYRSGAE